MFGPPRHDVERIRSTQELATRLEGSAFEVTQSDQLLEQSASEAGQSTEGQQKKHRLETSHRGLEQQVQSAGETSGLKALSWRGSAKWLSPCLFLLCSLEAPPCHHMGAE